MLPLRKNPHHFILHACTNNLNSQCKSELIAKSIVDVNLSIKKEKGNATISNIIIIFERESHIN